MLFLFAAAAAAMPAAETSAAGATRRQVTASVRIVAPARASRSDWKEAPPERRKELVVREADGRRTRVRVIEYE